MTEDFKEKTLKYLTGNITPSSGNNEPQFEPTQTITNNLNTYITNNIQGTWWSKTLIQAKDGNGNDLDIYGFVGNEEYNSVYYGFIVILDNTFTPIQFINTYSSGVRFGQIMSIKIDTNGNVYLVEYFNSESKYRVVLLNNIFMKLPTQPSYQCKIRISYFLPNELQTQLNSLDVFKSYTGNNYGFIGCNSEKLIVETLKIEVGLPNEWNNYTYDYSSLGFEMSYIAGQCYFENDTFDFRALLYQIGNTNIYKFYLDTTVTYSLIDISNYQYPSNTTLVAAEILQKELYYFGIMCAERSGSFTGNQKYTIVKYLNNNLAIINQKNSNTTIALPISRYRFFQKNGVVFFKLFYQINNSYNFDAGIIYNDEAFYFEEEDVGGTNPGIYSFNNAFIVTMSYNLINYYIPYSSYEKFYTCQQVFNQFNYNGLEYENINSLIPEYSNLYDENGNIIFSRNLYNLSINGNTTISTIEIPNAMLNNTTIVEQNLLSETNTLMNNNVNNITKNIYEVLDINFFNTLVMKNSNNPNNEILNNLGATRLNQSISSTNDYTDTIANKIRINYQDGTSIIQNIGTPTITNNVATYTITIYVPKAITNIEIISNDENTSYQTIVGTFGIGKYYTLTQDVRVE